MNKADFTAEGIDQGGVDTGERLAASLAASLEGIVRPRVDLGDCHGPNPALEALARVGVEAPLVEPHQVANLIVDLWGSVRYAITARPR